MTIGQKSTNPSPIKQLLVVNKSAGRIRFVLFLTIFFIYWSLIAQINLPLPTFINDIVQNIPNPTNFTTGIIQNILILFFSPTTIFFTFTPLIIFLLTNRLFIHFVNALFPSINKINIKRQINNCAFSSHPINYDVILEKNTDKHQYFDLVSVLGGPSKMIFPQESIAIIKKSKNCEYFVISSNKTTRKFTYSLSFDEKIFSTNSILNNKMHFTQVGNQNGSGNKTQLNNIDISIGLNIPNLKTGSIEKTIISEPDALFLTNLVGKKKELIESIINDEINNFLNSKFFPQILDNKFSTNATPNRSDFSNTLNRGTHTNYKKIFEINKYLPNKILRQHKYSIYQFINKQHQVGENNQNEKSELEKLSHAMILYLNEQLNLFFGVSKIQISSIKIDEIIFNLK